MNSWRNGSKEELLAAHAHIWNHIFNYINSMSLKCAVELGIPDIIHKHGRPISLSQLVHLLSIDQSKTQHIHRLMRILAHSGFFVKEYTCTHGDDEEQKDPACCDAYAYDLTPSSKLLLKDNPLSVAPFVLAMLNPNIMNPFHHLSEWFRRSSADATATPFEVCHERPFFEFVGRDDRLHQFFHDGMASDARFVSTVLLTSHREVFSGLTSMVDVGGGIGTFARAVADAFPELMCSVLELPRVVDGLESGGNMTFIGGDMFQSIPAADAVLLKWVLHDWNDEECVKILKRCKEAIPSKEKGGKVMIVDMVLMKEEAAAGEEVETQLLFDMLMMTESTGKERSEEEWAKLFFQAGFNHYKATPLLGLRSLIQVYYD